MLPETRVLASWADLDWEEYVSHFTLPMFVVYRHPSDHPDKYVMQLWDMDRPTPYAVLGKSEKDAAMTLPDSFVRLERNPADDPKIVCVYV
jgi:hypothetical protein